MSPTILKGNELETAADIFAVAFQNDPLYLFLEPDEKLRSLLLPIFFRHYLKLMIPYSYLVADSPSINSVALWYDDRKMTNSLLWKLRSIWGIVKGLEMCRHISLPNYLNKLSTLLKMDSGWILDYEKTLNWNGYIHLDMLAVRPTAKGKGYGHQLMTHGLETYSPDYPASTIETHNKDNIPYYQAYGYTLVKQIPMSNSSLVQYCMIRTEKNYKETDYE